jgi:hypothetical protein
VVFPFLISRYSFNAARSSWHLLDARIQLYLGTRQRTEAIYYLGRSGFVADRQSFAVYTSAGVTRFVLRRLPLARSVVHSRPMTNLLLWIAFGAGCGYWYGRRWFNRRAAQSTSDPKKVADFLKAGPTALAHLRGQRLGWSIGFAIIGAVAGCVICLTAMSVVALLSRG